MTVEMACQGIVERVLGKQYCEWFCFQLVSGAKEYFEIRQEGEQIRIEGTSGIAMAYGLKCYLRKWCNVYVGQQVITNRMPEQRVFPEKPYRKEAILPLRYAYNYCTLSYSMAYWDEKRWQRELDWLAMSGVNMVLDFTGIEEVWYQFLLKMGYSDMEARNWIVGPCYTAWQQMQNIEQYQGPIPRSFYQERAQLGRKNQSWMKLMGMSPVRQGYSGMVPSDHKNHEPAAEVYPQGTWNGFKRPAILNTDTELYKMYAEQFYRIQEEVLGEGSHFYAADVFHEGGIRPTDLTDERIAECVLEAMLKQDPKAVWVIQAWHDNPTEALIRGIHKMGAEHGIVLDLSATDNPLWKKHEFYGTSWIYCMLDMYGGRMACHGEPDVLAREIPKAVKASDWMKGVGITSEATLHNPIVFDLLYDMAWEQELDLEEWVRGWLKNRYGRSEQTVENAWKTLLETVYHDPGRSHHGGYTQIFSFRPCMEMQYGDIFNELNSSVIKRQYYDTNLFEAAVMELAAVRSEYEDQEAYCYDLQELFRQVLNNRAVEQALRARDAILEEDAQKLEAAKTTFFQLLDDCDELMCLREDTTLSYWLAMAENAGKPHGTERLFTEGFKRLITSWGERETYGSLVDYACRQYGGMLKCFYRKRWEQFFERKGNLSIDEWYGMNEQFVAAELELPLAAVPEKVFEKTIQLLKMRQPHEHIH